MHIEDFGEPGVREEVADVEADYRRLSDKGVAFTSEPVEMGGEKFAIFDDTCGNLIQIYQAPAD